MDLQLAHDIISICNEDSGGATVASARTGLTICAESTA